MHIRSFAVLPVLGDMELDSLPDFWDHDAQLDVGQQGTRCWVQP
jgi:hypothetical protein